MRTTIKWYNTVAGISGLPVGTRMFWLRPVGGDCAQDRSVFNSQSLAEKLANSYPAQPSSATGFVARSCDSGPVVDSVDVSAPNGEWMGGVTPPVDIVPPVAGDPSSYGVTSTFIY